MPTGTKLWIFQRPLHRDPLYILSVVVALAAGLFRLFIDNNGYYNGVALGVQVLIDLVLTFILTATLLGVVREFIRRRGE